MPQLLHLTNVTYSKPSFCNDPRSMGYFRIQGSDGGGGGGGGSPSICQTSGLSLDPKTAFDSPGLDISEYVLNLICRSLLTSQIGSKVGFLAIYHSWLRGAQRPYQNDA